MKNGWDNVGGVDNDILAGGPGNDILLGQQNQDYLMSDSGMDERYGGTGVDFIPPDHCVPDTQPTCDDPNSVMLDGPDRPDHQDLEAIKARALRLNTESPGSNPWTPAIVTDTLKDPFYHAERAFTTTQTGTGWITSDESFEVEAGGGEDGQRWIAVMVRWRRTRDKR